MITREQMIPQFLEKFPAFREVQIEYIKQYPWNQEREIGNYEWLEQFSKEVVRLLKTGHSEMLQDIFAYIDFLFSNGDEYVKNAVVVGLFEGIQANSIAGGLTTDAARKFVTPGMLFWWDESKKYFKVDPPPS